MKLPASANPSDAHAALGAAHSALREKCHTDAYPLAIEWIKSLIDAQQAHMTGCRPDRLEAAQIRLKMLMAMHRALAETGSASNGHAFD